MKLLFDENLSYHLVSLLSSDFPGCTQIELLSFRGITDRDIWVYAAVNDFIIVSKDNDFRQRAFLLGPPPKVIWLSAGNAGTKEIAALLRGNRERIDVFAYHPNEGLLIIVDE